jgi:hypothetical protein
MMRQGPSKMPVANEQGDEIAGSPTQANSAEERKDREQGRSSRR